VMQCGSCKNQRFGGMIPSECSRVYVGQTGHSMDTRLDEYQQHIHLWHSDRSAIKNGVFWDVMPCGSCKNRRFGGT
jgi:hypothetical protein